MKRDEAGLPDSLIDFTADTWLPDWWALAGLQPTPDHARPLSTPAPTELPSTVADDDASKELPDIVAIPLTN